MFPVDLLILDVAVILAAARLFGEAARRVGQSPVIGEIAAGIALGPTAFDRLTGGRLFPTTLMPPLSALADVGLVLFMFTVGLELDFRLIQGKIRIVAAVATGATAAPLALGCGLAVLLAPNYAHGHTTAFVLFFAVAVSATAFPVLARILTDRGMQQTLLGGIAVASAAAIDAVSYALLAVAIGIAAASGNQSWRLLFAPAYFLAMFFVVRPLLRRAAAAYERSGQVTPALLSSLLIGLFASAWATQWMQLNFIFGAFFFGAITPRTEHFLRGLLDGLGPAVQLLLPFFFAVTGLTVNLARLHLSALGVLAAILAVSILGKVGGGYAGARAAGIPRRGSAVLAALVNTRGLTEIVILTVGLQQHVLDPVLYSLLIVMALVTTAMTAPLLNRLYPDDRLRRDLADAARVDLPSGEVARPS